jgi:Uma2 family endonuclease
MIAPTKSISPARTLDAPRFSAPGDPTWEMAYLFPVQGRWSENEYFGLDENRFIEFEDGCIEVLPLPTVSHQLLADFLVEAMKAYVKSRKLTGRVMFGPVKLRLRRGKYREPDVLYVLPRQFGKDDRHVNGATVVFEIVSSGGQNRERDYVQKRDEYAAAGIPEYWIVDPEENCVTVLTLVGKKYRQYGLFQVGERAASKLLKGFEIAVNELFAAAKP